MCEHFAKSSPVTGLKIRTYQTCEHDKCIQNFNFSTERETWRNMGGQYLSEPQRRMECECEIALAASMSISPLAKTNYCKNCILTRIDKRLTGVRTSGSLNSCHGDVEYIAHMTCRCRRCCDDGAVQHTHWFVFCVV